MCGASGLTRIHLDPLRDVQLNEPCGWCSECGNELYPYNRDGICEKCRENNNDTLSD